jgi:hypothetical protein
MFGMFIGVVVLRWNCCNGTGATITIEQKRLSLRMRLSNYHYYNTHAAGECDTMVHRLSGGS